MLTLDIRLVQEKEIELLCALAERTFRDAWQDENDPDEFEAYCRENFSVENLSAELAVPHAEFYFALSDDHPVAYLKLNIDRPPRSPDGMAGTAVQLERIYVLQNFQSQRIGEQLIQFSEERARRAGAAWLWLSVWQKSPRTIRFYERNGFDIFGVETFWVGNDPQPDWLMRKRITD